MAITETDTNHKPIEILPPAFIKDVVTKIEQQPLIAVGIGILVGYLVGRLLSR